MSDSNFIEQVRAEQKAAQDTEHARNIENSKAQLAKDIKECIELLAEAEKDPSKWAIYTVDYTFPHSINQRKYLPNLYQKRCEVINVSIKCCYAFGGMWDDAVEHFKSLGYEMLKGDSGSDNNPKPFVYFRKYTPEYQEFLAQKDRDHQSYLHDKKRHEEQTNSQGGLVALAIIATLTVSAYLFWNAVWG